jgi:ABC-2 type transport system permease protein
VFYVVFQVVLKNGLPSFVIYLLCGLLVWNLFSAALTGATASVVANAPLVKKVDFPREVLPLASVGSAVVNFALQAVVLVIALVIARSPVDWGYVPLLVPALVALVVFAAGLGTLLSAVNVYLRDTQHFLELGLLAWFWFTPIIWYFGMVDRVDGPDRGAWLLLNPVTTVTLTFQRALYGRLTFRDGDVVRRILPDYGVGQHGLLIVALGAAGALLIGSAVFGRLEGSFAEQL